MCVRVSEVFYRRVEEGREEGGFRVVIVYLKNKLN